MRLRHLNLRVADADRCRAFYEEHFGFRLAFEAGGGYFLHNHDGFLLAVVPVDEHQRLPDGFHIGFTVETAHEVIETRERFAAAGVRVGKLEDERPGESYVTFRCWDPDGTEIEVFWDG
jgi:catechol 2,3-dioxygenase-like lactoylglutathione lyase family enzyme